jgi:GNAT superfamily N-acetyltransferase
LRRKAAHKAIHGVYPLVDEEKYIFREGKKGDRCAAGWADQTDIPTFVLEYENKQVGAAHGSLCYIVVIQTFEQGKGYGTKFIELWEKYAKEHGCKKVDIDIVGNEKLDHILRDKRNFELTQTDDYGDKTYSKKL